MANGATADVAAAAIAKAVKASGAIVQAKPRDFAVILDKTAKSSSWTSTDDPHD